MPVRSVFTLSVIKFLVKWVLFYLFEGPRNISVIQAPNSSTEVSPSYLAAGAESKGTTSVSPGATLVVDPKNIGRLPTEMGKTMAVCQQNRAFTTKICGSLEIWLAHEEAFVDKDGRKLHRIAIVKKPLVRCNSSKMIYDHMFHGKIKWNGPKLDWWRSQPGGRFATSYTWGFSGAMYAEDHWYDWNSVRQPLFQTPLWWFLVGAVPIFFWTIDWGWSSWGKGLAPWIRGWPVLLRISPVGHRSPPQWCLAATVGLERIQCSKPHDIVPWNMKKCVSLMNFPMIKSI